MQKFKAGDIVELIFPLSGEKYRGDYDRMIKDKLTSGGKYTIDCVTKNGITLTTGIFTHPREYFKLVGEERKILGWKPKGEISPLFGQKDKWQELIKVQGWAFDDNSANYHHFKNAGILEVLWEPVYEISKLEIDINDVHLTIHEDGYINFKFQSNNSFTTIKALEGILKQIYFGNVGNYKVVCTEVHIGCEDGVRFKISEIESIIEQYKTKFNK